MNETVVRKLIVIAGAVIFFGGIGIVAASQGVSYYNNLDTDNPPTRKQSEYTQLIINKIPSMKDPSGEALFSIVSAVKLQDDWYEVTIENFHNQDRLTTLVYDPKNGAEFMELVLPPSVRFTPEENLSNIPIPEEVITKMNQS